MRRAGDDDDGDGAQGHLAHRVNDDLAEYGFDLCQGGVMAREAKYFGCLAEWKSRVGNMITNAHRGPEQRDLTIFLDMRHVVGDEHLTESLWRWALIQLGSNHATVRSLADDAVTKIVPLNFLGRFRYETGEGGRRGIDVKKYGMLPLTAGARALAIDRGLRCTATHDRIVSLGEMGFFEKDTVADLLSAHELFLRLKLQASIEQVFQGRAAGSFFYPQDWTDLERFNLKRPFRAVDHLLSFIRLHFAM